MEPLLPPSVATNWINTIGAWIGFVHNTSLFIYVYYKNKTDGKELSNGNPLQQQLYIGTLITYFSFVLYNITTIMLQTQSIYEAITCTITFELTVATYILSRYSVWMFNLLRVRIIFQSKVIHSLGYTTKTLIIIAIIFTVVYIMYNISAFTTSEGVETFINETDSFCHYEINPLWLSFFNAAADQWCTIGCFILFYKKMRSTNKLTIKIDTDNKTVIYLLKKYAVLMATNLISSWILVLLIMLSSLGAFAGSLDSMINMWTIVLFDARYDKHYKKTFSCLLSSKQSEDVIRLESVIESTQNIPSNDKNKENVIVSSSPDMIAHIH